MILKYFSHKNFIIIRIAFIFAIINLLFSACGGGSSSSSSDSSNNPYSGYGSAIESAFFKLPSSITGSDTAEIKKSFKIVKAEAPSTPGGIIDTNFPWQIIHTYIRELAGWQVDLIDCFKDLSIIAIKDTRIFFKPGTPYISDFTLEGENYTTSTTAYDDTANGYRWKVVMAMAETPDVPFLIFRFTVNDEEIKGRIRTSTGEDDGNKVVFVNGDIADDIAEIIYETYIEINFIKTAEKSTIQWKETVSPESLTEIRNFLTDNNRFIDSPTHKDKIKDDNEDAEESLTSKGAGPGFTDMTFIKDNQYCTISAMFYFPLIKEYPELYYYYDKKGTGNEICTWTFRGKAILATDRSRVDFAYPLFNSTSVDWTDTHTVFKRLWPTAIDWKKYVTNSALFEGSNHFIGFLDDTNFSEYNAVNHELDAPVTAPVSIQDLTYLDLNDIVVPSTVDVKNMGITLD